MTPVQREPTLRVPIPEELLPIKGQIATLSTPAVSEACREARSTWLKKVREPRGELASRKEALQQTWSKERDSLQRKMDSVTGTAHSLRTELDRLQVLRKVAEQIAKGMLAQLEPKSQSIVETLIARHSKENPEIIQRALRKLSEGLLEKCNFREQSLREKDIPLLLQEQAKLEGAALAISRSYSFRGPRHEFFSPAGVTGQDYTSQDAHSRLKSLEEDVAKAKEELMRAEPTILSPKVREAVKTLPGFLQHLEQPELKNSLHPCHRLALQLLLKNDPSPLGEHTTTPSPNNGTSVGQQFVREALLENSLEEVQTSLTILIANLFERTAPNKAAPHHTCSVDSSFAHTFFQSARDSLKTCLLLKELTGLNEKVLIDTPLYLQKEDVHVIHERAATNSSLGSMRAIFRIKPELLSSEPAELVALIDTVAQYRKRYQEYLSIKEFNPETNPNAFASKEAIRKKGEEIDAIIADPTQRAQLTASLAEAKLGIFVAGKGIHTPVSIVSSVLTVIFRSASESGERGDRIVERVKRRPENGAVTTRSIRAALDELERCGIISAVHRTPYRNSKTASYFIKTNGELETILHNLSPLPKEQEAAKTPEPVRTAVEQSAKVETKENLAAGNFQGVAKQTRNSLRGLARNIDVVNDSLSQLTKLSNEVVEEWLKNISLIQNDIQNAKNGTITALSDEALKAIRDGILDFRQRATDTSNPSETKTPKIKEPAPLNRANVIADFSKLSQNEQEKLNESLLDSMTQTLRHHCNESTRLFTTLSHHYRALNRILRDRSSAFSSPPRLEDEIAHRLSHDYTQEEFHFEELLPLLRTIPKTRDALLRKGSFIKEALQQQHLVGSALVAMLEKPDSEPIVKPEEILRFCGNNIRLPDSLRKRLEEQKAREETPKNVTSTEEQS